MMHHVKQAIIMAAGLGSRLAPITSEIPKPLIKVNGTPMIETVIQALLKNDITNIYIVVGHLKEKFLPLQQNYPMVTLIENPYYASCNNISSLYSAREYLNKETIILDGDQIIYHPEILKPDFSYSGYCSIWTDEETDEWLQTVENGFVTSCSRTGGKHGWQLFSVSFWTKEDALRLRDYLITEFETKKNRQIYWDDIALFCYPEEFQLQIHEISKGDLIEVDNLDELKQLDSSYNNCATTNKPANTPLFKQLDLISTLVPLAGILILCLLFFIIPEESTLLINTIRHFLGDDFGIYYILLGIGTLCCTLYMAFSKYGKIKLGALEKPQYSSFKWGTMIFTSTMAADILYYSLCEWALYAQEPHIENMGGIQEWASTYPLFHWGPIAWCFYIALAVAFGFMLHVRGKSKQKFSEACRPLLGNKIDGFWGKLIDLIAVFSLLAGTATTFSLATPLLSAALSHIFGFPNSTALSILVLLLIAFIYTLTVWFGMKGISRLASFCTYLFFVLLIYVLIGGGETRYIIETGISSLGNMLQNFIGISTWTDPLRETSFPQNWTIFYWAYWMVWCVATPFFIGTISKGRTIRNTVLGGYAWGLAGTFTSFIILGNYGLAQQMKHGLDTSSFLANGGSIPNAILRIFATLPLSKLGLLLLAVTMIAFYSTTFDALTMVISSYSYKELPVNQEPDKRVRTFWSILFILFPIALIFSENSMSSLQSVSIIAAFPVGIIVILILVSFFKDAKQYMENEVHKKT